MRFNILLILLLCFLGRQLQAQEEEDKTNVKFYHELQISGLIGGQISNENFVYQSGLSAQYLANLRLSKRVSYGFGFGYERLIGEETFLPIFLEFKGFTSKKKHPNFLSMQLGYAFAQHPGEEAFVNYRFQGGLFFSPGIGRQFKLGKEIAFALSLHYKHQFARLSYENFGTRYEETLNFDFLVLRLAMSLNP